MRREVLVLEPRHRGHHARHAEWLVRGGVSRGLRVVLATSAEGAGLPRLAALPAELGPAAELFPVDAAGLDGPDGEGPAGLARRQLLERRRLGEWLRARYPGGGPHALVVPYLDSCAQAVALRGSPFGSLPWCGLVMRPTFHLPEARPSALRWLRRLLFSRLLRCPALKALFTVDRSLLEFARGRWPALASRLCHVGDPAELRPLPPRAAARSALGVPPRAWVVLVYGEIAARKGIDALLASVASPAVPAEVNVLLAGPHRPDAAAALASGPAAALRSAGRLHQRDGYLSLDEEAAAFAAADAVWLGYRGHLHPSGVLVQAGQAGVPVVACREGLVGRLTIEAGCGLAVAIDDPGQVAAALDRLTRDPGLAGACAESGRRFFSGHTPAAFAEALLDAALA